MAGRGTSWAEKVAYVPGHCEVPSPYNRPKPACWRVPADAVSGVCRACPRVKIRLSQKLAININKLMLARHPCPGTRHRGGGFRLPIFLRLASSVPLLSRQGIVTA